jgi:hypothetical protein
MIQQSGAMIQRNGGYEIHYHEILYVIKYKFFPFFTEYVVALFL